MTLIKLDFDEDYGSKVTYSFQNKTIEVADDVDTVIIPNAFPLGSYDFSKVFFYESIKNQLLTFISSVEGTLNGFRLRDPCDNYATYYPEYFDLIYNGSLLYNRDTLGRTSNFKYDSQTQGVLRGIGSSSSTSTTIYYLYKAYEIVNYNNIAYDIPYNTGGHIDNKPDKQPNPEPSQYNYVAYRRINTPCTDGSFKLYRATGNPAYTEILHTDSTYGWTLDYDTGILTFNNTQSLSLNSFYWEGNFDTYVRFMTDDALNIELKEWDEQGKRWRYQLPNLKFIEIKKLGVKCTNHRVDSFINHTFQLDFTYDAIYEPIYKTNIIKLDNQYELRSQQRTIPRISYRLGTNQKLYYSDLQYLICLFRVGLTSAYFNFYDEIRQQYDYFRITNNSITFTTITDSFQIFPLHNKQGQTFEVDSINIINGIKQCPVPFILPKSNYYKYIYNGSVYNFGKMPDVPDSTWGTVTSTYGTGTCTQIDMPSTQDFVFTDGFSMGIKYNTLDYYTYDIDVNGAIESITLQTGFSPLIRPLIKAGVLLIQNGSMYGIGDIRLSFDGAYAEIDGGVVIYHNQHKSDIYYIGELSDTTSLPKFSLGSPNFTKGKIQFGLFAYGYTGGQTSCNFLYVTINRKC